MNVIKTWRGACEPPEWDWNRPSVTGLVPALTHRGAVERGEPSRAVQIGVGRQGGHAVESEIAGFAGFNIQRPKDRPAPAKKR